MISVPTAADSRALDRHTLQAGDVAAVDLMRNAGRAVAIEAAKIIRGDTTRSLLIVCGKGHNGGDGLAAAGFLTRWGYPCTVALVGGRDEWDEVVAATYRSAGVEVREQARPGGVSWAEPGLVIDALLGVGASRPLKGLLSGWVRAINGFAGPVLAVDLPTGLNSDTGQPMNEAVKAQVTVTMGYPKLARRAWPLSIARSPWGLLYLLQALPWRQPEAHRGYAG